MDEFYMFEAIKEAEKALQRGDYPIGAIVVLDNKIISRDGNRTYSSNNLLAHAEINTLIKIPRDFLKENKNKLSLYTTYEPCPMCFGAIIQCYIGKLFHGIDLDNSGATNMKKNFPKFYDFSKRGEIKIIGGILEDKCRDVFMKSSQAQKMLEKGFINNL
jgi:tRNA(adenine34) deaminase